MNPEPAESAAPPEHRQAHDSSRDFAAVAKRVSGWAGNLLVSGVILIAGLAFGRQAIVWWTAAAEPGRRTDHVVATLGPELIGGDDHSPLLEFGDFPLVLQRSPRVGDIDFVLDELRTRCRAAADRVMSVDRVPGPAELRMLAGTRRLEPAEATRSWRIYQISTPLPMVVAVRDFPPGRYTNSLDDQVAAVDSRVVCWGLALPVAKQAAADLDHWTLFTFAADAESALTSAARRHVPIPPGARRTMTLQAETGAVVVGFRGQGQAEQWKQFYDQQLGTNRWTGAAEWLDIRGAWQRRFTNPQFGQLDVQFTGPEDGILNGLLQSAPPPAGAAEN